MIERINFRLFCSDDVLKLYAICKAFNGTTAPDSKRSKIPEIAKKKLHSMGFPQTSSDLCPKINLNFAENSSKPAENTVKTRSRALQTSRQPVFETVPERFHKHRLPVAETPRRTKMVHAAS